MLKKILSICLSLSCFLSEARNPDMQIGLSAGSILYHYLDFSYFEIITPLSNQQYGSLLFVPAQKIHSYNFPTLFISGEISKHLSARLSCQYTDRASGDFNFWWGDDFAPETNQQQKYLYVLHYEKSLQVMGGLQYNFHVKKWTLYPAIDFGYAARWSKDILHYRIDSIPQKSFTATSTDAPLGYYDIRLLLGCQYRVSPHFSFTYEGGLLNDQLGIISRLSIDYHFTPKKKKSK